MVTRLKDLREDSDLTQKQLCKLINYKQQTYSCYEVGSRTLPYELLVVLAKFYNTSTDYILGLTNEVRPYPRINENEKNTNSL